MALTLLLTVALLLAALNVAAAAYVAGLSARRRAMPAGAMASGNPNVNMSPGPQVMEISTYGPGQPARGTKPVPPLSDNHIDIIRLNAAAASRSNPNTEDNGDSWICESNAGIFAVLDGDGRRGGEASRKATKSILRWIMITRGKEGLETLGSDDPVRETHRLGLALDHAHAEVCNLKRAAETHLDEFQCSAVTAVVAGGQLLFGWCGGAHAFLMRNGLLTEIVPEDCIRDEGQGTGDFLPLDMDEPEYMTCASEPLGSEGIVEAATGRSGIESGDRFLLCSNGLVKTLGERTLREILDRPHSAEEIAERLVTSAANSAPDDDMTAVVIEAEAIHLGASRRD
ncbi:MAG TPA: hypothetical protein VMX35_00280 [Acidobacteriota bacterium]|nr:hypothetical protein [Acidobacteriota bacterium]